jgi:hypothetical protein|tara:strand:- start:97 stop:474 length:378 start_codon:yes stop_codon:yes gene_type:complete
MSKFIYVEADENKVKYVEDTRPTNALGPLYIEVSNDSVAEHWFYNRETGEVSEYEPYTVGQVRQMRDEKLTVSDWMVLEDSPYKATGQESNLTAIKTYRQELRDFPDESKSYNENNINWPTLTLS